jgi:DNA-binding MarR family transcriptional regulator
MMGSDKAQMARAVKDLEDRALVARQAHQFDWRAQCLHLTAYGKRVHALLSAQRAALGREVSGDLSGKELAQLESALQTMRTRLVSGQGNDRP